MIEQYSEFSNRLNRLGSGDRAALRRSAGDMLEHADGRALTVFYRCLPNNIPAYQEGKWFAVACLRCLWDAGDEGSESLPELLCNMRSQELLSDSVVHRVEILMDTPWNQDGYMLKKLYRLIVLVRQKNGAILAFQELLEDLLGWNWENQQIQRKWARIIFGTKQTEKGEDNDAD